MNAEFLGQRVQIKSHSTQVAKDNKKSNSKLGPPKEKLGKLVYILNNFLPTVCEPVWDVSTAFNILFQMQNDLQ